MRTRIAVQNVSVIFGLQKEDSLRLADLGRSREEIQAATGDLLGVHDCSLSVAEGEILVLMGLSGSGKSTLLRTVNGSIPSRAAISAFIPEPAGVT